MKKGRCIKCGKLTPYALRYDMDGSPIWTHKKCEEDVRLALIMLCSGDKKNTKEFTKDWYNPLT